MASEAAQASGSDPTQLKPQRRLTLTLALAVSVGGLLVVLLASSFVLEPLLFNTAAARAQERKRYHRLILNEQRLMIAMLDQAVGLRAYLATGNPVFLEPYKQGVHNEGVAKGAIEADLSPSDRDKVARAWLEAQRAGIEWQAAIAEPQRLARAFGPIPDLDIKLLDGKRYFDRIRVAHAQLRAAFEDRSTISIADINSQLEALHQISLITAGSMALLGLIFIALFLKHTAKPLAELAQTASQQGTFAPPAADTRIAEVYTLSAALYNLDQSVRAREQLIQASHERALGLAQFSELVQQIADEQELRNVLGRTLLDEARPSKAQILLRKASRNRLEIAWPEVPSDEQYNHAILAAPIKCRAVRTLQVVTADAGTSRCCDCTLGVPEAGSYVCMPMLAAGDLVGIVNLQSRAPGGFSPDVLHLVRSHIRFASTALSSIRLLASAHERALRDPLTGAYNRTFLSEHLEKQLSLARRRKAPLALLMLDLDHFKRLNDNYGHQIGDRALLAFVACMNSTIRGADTVVRYGGEEFVVLLPDAKLSDALEVAERVRTAVAALTLDTGREQLAGQIRTSIGLAVFPTHGDNEAKLVAAADRALYEAKSTGRNRVVVADTNPEAVSA